MKKRPHIEFPPYLYKLSRLWRRFFPERGVPYFQNCRELPLENFIRCLTHGQVSYLLKRDGTPTITNREKLEKVWNNIFYEYVDLVGDPDHRATLILVRDIARYEGETALFYEVWRQLRNNYNQSLVDLVRKMGYPGKYDPTNQQEYFRELDLAFKKHKAKIFELDRKRREMAEINQRAEKRGKRTVDYEELLAELSAFQGYKIDTKSTTVAEFCAVVKRYRKHQERIKNQKKHV